MPQNDQNLQIYQIGGQNGVKIENIDQALMEGEERKAEQIENVGINLHAFVEEQK